MRRSFCSLILILGALTACGDGNAPKGSLPGSYNMSTIDGARLPFLIFDDGTSKLEIKSGTFLITGNSTYTETVTLRLTENGVVDEAPAICTGTYTQSGNNLTLTESESEDCGGTWNATWDGRNSLTVNYGFLEVVYKR